MNKPYAYRDGIAFAMAVALHLAIGVFFAWTPSEQRPVLIEATKDEAGALLEKQNKAAQSSEIVHATSVNAQELSEAVHRLKQTKQAALEKEQARQAALKKEMERARQARVAEQQRLAALKQEEEKIALARKKTLREEKRRLKALAEQKEKEMRALEALKKEQQLAAQKQAAMMKEQAQAAEKAKAEAKAALEAARQAKLAGVVSKYKALILSAISRQWILPDHVQPGLSSKFKIRLAPNGSVLEVSLLRSSGDAILDRSAQTAIYKASPLPVPSDPGSFDVFREISLTVRPEQLRG